MSATVPFEAVYEAGWVTVVPAEDRFSVSVDEYAATEAAQAGYAARTAVVTVTAGEAEPVAVAICQAAPDAPAEPTVAFDPSDTVFEAGGELTALVWGVTEVESFSVTVPDGFDWIVEASVTGDLISIAVSPYVGDTERKGYVEVVSPELSEPARLAVTQYPEEPVNLTGTWNWTGREWKGGAYAEASGTLTLAYDAGLSGWLATPLVSSSSGMTGTGGMLLEVHGNNEVCFVHGRSLGLREDFFGMIFFAYRNMIGLIGEDLYLSEHAFAEGEKIVLELNDDRNSIAFPSAITVEGDPCDYGFGFGGVSYYPSTGEESDTSTISPIGLWKDFVLTRAQ